jgi:hypothetical protein
MFKGKKQYLIKWAGYSHKENTWEPASIIKDKKLIRNYERILRGREAREDIEDYAAHLYLISSTPFNILEE